MVPQTKVGPIASQAPTSVSLTGSLHELRRTTLLFSRCQMSMVPPPSPHFVVKLFGSDPTGRTMSRVGCLDVEHGFESGGRGIYTRLLVDDADPRQHSFLMELVDNPANLRAINRAPTTPPPPSSRGGRRGSG